MSNQFDIKDIIYQAGKIKLSDIEIFSTSTNNSVKPYLENTNKTTKITTATTATTAPPTKATSTTTITTATTATLGQNSNKNVPVSPECNKTPSNITYESDKRQNYANTTIFASYTDSDRLPNNNNGPVSLNVFAGSNEVLNDDIYFCDWKNINDIDIEKYRLLRDGKICTKQIPHLHSIPCNEEDFPTEHFLNRHLKQAHFNRAHCVEFENNPSLPCRNKNHAMSKLKRKISHFYCPICKKIGRQKVKFQKHLSIHTDKITKNTNFKIDAISNAEHQNDIKSLKEHLPPQFEDQKIGLLQEFAIEENPLDECQKTKEITFQK